MNAPLIQSLNPNRTKNAQYVLALQLKLKECYCNLTLPNDACKGRGALPNIRVFDSMQRPQLSRRQTRCAGGSCLSFFRMILHISVMGSQNADAEYDTSASKIPKHSTLRKHSVQRRSHSRVTAVASRGQELLPATSQNCHVPLCGLIRSLASLYGPICRL